MFIFTSLGPFRNGRPNDIADRITARDDGAIHFFDFILLRFLLMREGRRAVLPSSAILFGFFAFFRWALMRFFAIQVAGKETIGEFQCCHLLWNWRFLAYLQIEFVEFFFFVRFFVIYCILKDLEILYILEFTSWLTLVVEWCQTLPPGDNYKDFNN